MYLKRWLFENDMTVTDFCMKIKNHRNHVYACMAGKKIAGKKLRNIVFEFTDGDVKLNDWPENPDDVDFMYRTKARSKSLFRDENGQFIKKEK